MYFRCLLLFFHASIAISRSPMKVVMSDMYLKICSKLILNRTGQTADTVYQVRHYAAYLKLQNTIRKVVIFDTLYFNIYTSIMAQHECYYPHSLFMMSYTETNKRLIYRTGLYWRVSPVALDMSIVFHQLKAYNFIDLQVRTRGWG
jgi:hypothetical protein